MALATTNPICVEICAALGLKNVTKLELKMEMDNVVSVNATYFPEIDGVKQLPAILATYELIDKREVDQLREDSSELTRRIVRGVWEEERIVDLINRATRDGRIRKGGA